MGDQGKQEKKDKKLSAQELIDRAHSYKQRRYQVSTNTVDKTLHAGPIRQSVYVPSLDFLSLVELGSKVVKLYTPTCNVSHVLEVPAKEMKEQEVFIIAAAYSEKENMFAAVASDKYCYMWEGPHHNYKFNKKVQLDQVQIGLWYMEGHGK